MVTKLALPTVLRVDPMLVRAASEAASHAKATNPRRLAEKTAIVVGNFDGVHRGHAAVIDQMKTRAEARGLVPSVLTFDPHPAVILGRPSPPVLTPLSRKIELFREHGIEQVFVVAFSIAFSESSPELFANELLFDALGAHLVMVGKNFRFGKARAGDFAALESFAHARGHEAFSAVLESDEQGPVSSTRIRAAIATGEVELAARGLGRPHAFSGTVIHGAAKGRTIGFPTANLGGVVEILPANGVYAVSVDLLEGSEPETAKALAHGVMNVGTRPTVDGDGTIRHVEVNLFDFDGDLYGSKLRVHVRARVRDERKFPSFGELKKQIALDANTARELTESLKIPASGSFG